MRTEVLLAICSATVLWVQRAVSSEDSKLKFYLAVACVLNSACFFSA